MIILDIHHDVEKSGNFLSLVGIADLHLLCDDEDDAQYQPLDPESWNYLKYCINEIKSNPSYYGKPVFYTGGDLTELERSSVRKGKRAVLHKNDSRAEDSIHKKILNHDVIPKIARLIEGGEFLGGVAGNHLIEFCDRAQGHNSEEYIINKLGGTYCGEGKMLVNLHIRLGSNRMLKKILITHGVKAGTKAAIVGELQRIYQQYGSIDVVIKCHAHDPMTHFHCRYDLPDRVGGRIKKQETLVMCLGSTRDGEKIGYDDYSERGNYAPTAARFPIAVFHAYKSSLNNNSLVVKVRPIIM
jgi:hypothetical protein